MTNYSDYYQAIDLMVDILRRDLVGPVREDETLTEAPHQFYMAGKLYGRRGPFDLSTCVDDTGEEGAGERPVLENPATSLEDSLARSNNIFPSTMAITCAVGTDVRIIAVDVQYAVYESRMREDDKQEQVREPEWIRKPHATTQEVDLMGGQLQSWELPAGVTLQFRSKPGDNVLYCTAVLVNTNLSGSRESVSKTAVFQPKITFRALDAKPVFVDVTRHALTSTDPEMLEQEMLYSDAVAYGQGHGCSVEWDTEHEQPQWISSQWIPVSEVLQMMPSSIADTGILSMDYLAAADASDLLEGLAKFTSQYATWIDDLEKGIPGLGPRYAQIALRNVQLCRDACQRMREAVNLLRQSAEGDGQALRAFRLANEAMAMQRRQTVKISGGQESAPRWYPFQLGFILHELSALIDSSLPEREIVDVLWFPTGGGKTETYLALTAFAVFMRRIRDPRQGGVVAIMRYTLRLLTLQQFERATRLICACEILRRREGLGTQEISIGLWVGGALTPNTLKEASINLSNKRDGRQLHEGDPCQIHVCPWCGQTLSTRDYSIDSTAQRMHVRCPASECAFHDGAGLPMHLVDESVYTYRPSFLVATIDKFAQLPMKSEPAAFFGIGCDDQGPELIIQDELHLISGPLGTVAGAYEAAITQICAAKGVAPKIIASTATIRHAKEQVLALYGRNCSQFPPSGINHRDSYFAVEATRDQKPSRTFVGVLGTGQTQTTTLVNTFGDILYTTRYLEARGFPEKVVDNYWTIVGYFNTLRELGVARSQMEDYVQNRFQYLGRTKFADAVPAVDTGMHYGNIEELTSRKNSAEIADIIQVRLPRPYTRGNHKDVYDFVAATNMISVGIDVGRLGLMVMVGQPKSHAEYIQATSRVGRDNPGLVVNVYGAMRTRDRSHYEQFTQYHSALYRYVEALSLTPFADRARDRTIAAAYVTMCRYLVVGLLENGDAKRYDPNDPAIQSVRQALLDYIERLDPQELVGAESDICEIEDKWERRTSDKLKYWHAKGGALLDNVHTHQRMYVPNSMRNVEDMVPVMTWEERDVTQFWNNKEDI